MKKLISPEEKARVVLESLRGEKTINQISGLFQIHPTQINNWKKIAKNGLASLFSDKRSRENKNQEELIAELYKIIGERDYELSWLKKKLHLES